MDDFERIGLNESDAKKAREIADNLVRVGMYNAHESLASLIAQLMPVPRLVDNLTTPSWKSKKVK